ncbi:hypothetical protein [Pseudoalteromonas luteoviolacea]|uniref:t-SNARE coiled-coil homology domain-containing protein n=1 Tax=Pseudoalteromonas luteoviolacea H33 TaxID=1365251 RepID=A0A167G1X9_9GAMM|nr:hypothetical protein [Pseudoalteromonas luteoviolacea]KZN53864.1 hypothetical protein N476_26500 [Pseudoalteromonas luteoviolacea H33]KZN74610.1 hypothetical protein N477_21520 [Pseudoalteromonas luteoviolacea H33-S]MBQ4880035.1 hypothetical protein [Pseudoalteromonas luteoviolacea]MBQ4909052.1 hypothetical protein [Pseudoalteromonas luteoviolacea]
MKKVIILGTALSIMPLTVGAESSVVVPHEFIANTPAKADEVNENFSFLSDNISENQTELAELNTSLTAVVSGLNSQLTSANEKIETNTTSISALQQAVSGNENIINNFIDSASVSIQSLQTDKQQKTVQITQINTSLGSIRAEIADQAQTITVLNTASTQNGAALEVMNTSLQVQSQAVSLANTRIQANENSLSALQQKVTQQEVVDTNIENRVTQLNTGISSVNTQLQANENSLNALQQRVTQQEVVDTNIENRVTQLSNGISSLNTQLSAISTRSQNNENSITALNSSQTTLNTDVTNLDSAVSDLSATVNTQSSTISTIQSSVQGHGGRLDVLEAARQPIQTYDPIINPHEDILDAPINYSYIATAPGDVFSLHGENFRMYRFPVMDFETNQRYAVDIPLIEGDTYESIGVNSMCGSFHLSPSQLIGDNAKAIFSVRGTIERKYTMSRDKIESSFSLQKLRPQIQVKIGRYSCFSLTLGQWSGSMEVDGQGALASGQYDLTNGFNWPAKADRIDEVIDFRSLANYVRVTAL